MWRQPPAHAASAQVVKVVFFATPSNTPTATPTTSKTPQPLLAGAISATDSSLIVTSGGALDSQGTIQIDQEFIDYSGKTGNTLYGLVRGAHGTTAAAHAAGAPVIQIVFAPSVDLTGTWSGSWQSVNGIDAGPLSADLAQNGSTVSGSITFGGSPCFSQGTFSGTVSGNSVQGAMFAGAVRVDIDAAGTASAMNGPYSVVSGGACTGDTGTFSLAKAPTPSKPSTSGGSGCQIGGEQQTAPAWLFSLLVLASMTARRRQV